MELNDLEPLPTKRLCCTKSELLFFYISVCEYYEKNYLHYDESIWMTYFVCVF